MLSVWWPACGIQRTAEVWSAGSILMGLWRPSRFFVLPLGIEKESMLQKHKGLLDLCVCSRLYRCELTSKCRSLMALMCVFLGEREMGHFQHWEDVAISAVHLISPVYIIPFFEPKDDLFYRGMDIRSFKLKLNISLSFHSKHFIMHSTTDFFIPNIPSHLQM